MEHPNSHILTQKYAETLAVDYFLAYHNGTPFDKTQEDIEIIDPEIRLYICGMIQQILRGLRPASADHFIQNVVNRYITEGPKYV